MKIFTKPSLIFLSLIPLLLFAVILFSKYSKQTPGEIVEWDKLSPDMKHLLTQCPISDGFDFPVGKPDGEKYYNARPFGVKSHLGGDWNGYDGGNSDLGDPVYAIGNGIVSYSNDAGGDWGNIVRIIHKTGKNKYVESLYAHLQKKLIRKGDIVVKGQPIGNIGNNKDQHDAHLHFEVRSRVGMPIGGGYGIDTDGYLNPTKFLLNNR